MRRPWTTFLAGANIAAMLGIGLVVGRAFSMPGELPVVRPVPDVGPPIIPRPDFSLEAALNAPIFNANRRLGEAGRTTTPAQPPPPLAGVVAHGSGTGVAVVVVDGKQRVVRVGGEVGGWRLLALSRRSALFARGAERAESKLLAGPSQSASTQPLSPVSSGASLGQPASPSQ